MVFPSAFREWLQHTVAMADAKRARSNDNGSSGDEEVPDRSRMTKRQRQRLDQTPAAKAAHALNIRVTKCVADDDADTALNAYNDAVKQGIKPSNRVYTMLLSLCASAGKLAAAKELHDTMASSKRLTLDEAAYSNLVRAAAGAGSSVEALRFLAEMKVRVCPAVLMCRSRCLRCHVFHWLTGGWPPASSAVVLAPVCCAGF